jgi:hypothetical protein
MKEFLIIAIVIALIVFGPFATMWALNTIFPALEIPYNFDTWCAVIILKGFAITTISHNK